MHNFIKNSLVVYFLFLPCRLLLLVAHVNRHLFFVFVVGSALSNEQAKEEATPFLTPAGILQADNAVLLLLLLKATPKNTTTRQIRRRLLPRIFGKGARTADDDVIPIILEGKTNQF